MVKPDKKRTIIFLVALIITLLTVIFSSYGQNYENSKKLRYNVSTSFYYNSYLQYIKEYKQVDHDYHQDMTFEADLYVPFSAFEEVSPLFSERFSFYAKGGFIYDVHETTIKNSIWDFNLEFRLIKDQPIFLQAEISAINVSGHNASTYNFPRIHGEEISIGIHYNNQKHFKNRSSFKNKDVNSQLINFYAQFDYLIYSEYILIEPYVRELNQDNSNTIKNTIGVVLNIRNVLYFEQGINVITKHNLFDEITMSPYYSDFNTKVTLAYKKLNLAFEHICYHPLVSDNENPYVEGVTNNISLNLEF